jgi:hypothetical protein
MVQAISLNEQRVWLRSLVLYGLKDITDQLQKQERFRQTKKPFTIFQAKGFVMT